MQLLIFILRCRYSNEIARIRCRFYHSSDPHKTSFHVRLHEHRRASTPNRQLLSHYSNTPDAHAA